MYSMCVFTCPQGIGASVHAIFCFASEDICWKSIILLRYPCGENLSTSGWRMCALLCLSIFAFCADTLKMQHILQWEYHYNNCLAWISSADPDLEVREEEDWSKKLIIILIILLNPWWEGELHGRRRPQRERMCDNVEEVGELLRVRLLMAMKVRSRTIYMMWNLIGSWESCSRMGVIGLMEGVLDAGGRVLNSATLSGRTNRRE